MRVLHLVEGYPPTGGCAGRWCQGLSRALVARDVAVQVLSVASRAEGSELAWGGADIDEGVRVRRAAASAPLHLLRRLRPGWRTRSPRPWSGALRGILLRAAAAHDVVHVHGVGPPHAWWAVVGCRLARRTFVYSPGLHERRALTASVSRLVSRADAVVVFHPGEGDWLRGAGSRIARLEEVDDPGPPHGRGGGPAWRSLLGLAEGDRLVVFPARADWESGAVAFIDAVRLLRLAGVRSRLPARWVGCWVRPRGGATRPKLRSPPRPDGRRWQRGWRRCTASSSLHVGGEAARRTLVRGSCPGSGVR